MTSRFFRCGYSDASIDIRERRVRRYVSIGWGLLISKTMTLSKFLRLSTNMQG